MINIPITAKSVMDAKCLASKERLPFLKSPATATRSRESLEHPLPASSEHHTQVRCRFTPLPTRLANSSKSQLWSSTKLNKPSAQGLFTGRSPSGLISWICSFWILPHVQKGAVPETPMEETHRDVGNAEQEVSWIAVKPWMHSCAMDTQALPSPSLPWLCLQHELHFPKYKILTERIMADLMALWAFSALESIDML